MLIHQYVPLILNCTVKAAPSHLFEVITDQWYDKDDILFIFHLFFFFKKILRTPPPQGIIYPVYGYSLPICPPPRLLFSCSKSTIFVSFRVWFHQIGNHSANVLIWGCNLANQIWLHDGVCKANSECGQEIFSTFWLVVMELHSTHFATCTKITLPPRVLFVGGKDAWEKPSTRSESCFGSAINKTLHMEMTINQKLFTSI